MEARRRLHSAAEQVVSKGVCAHPITDQFLLLLPTYPRQPVAGCVPAAHKAAPAGSAPDCRATWVDGRPGTGARLLAGFQRCCPLLLQPLRPPCTAFWHADPPTAPNALPPHPLSPLPCRRHGGPRLRHPHQRVCARHRLVRPARHVHRHRRRLRVPLLLVRGAASPSGGMSAGGATSNCGHPAHLAQSTSWPQIQHRRSCLPPGATPATARRAHPTRRH